MVIVVGSRHDRVAGQLVAEWPGSALCTAEDLFQAGWVLRPTRPEKNRWVVGGRVVPDTDVSGILVRRSSVYPEELVGVDPADRTYLAAEGTALLIAMLGGSSARVVNPVTDGGIGSTVWRPERWLQFAGSLGLPVRPLRSARAHNPVATTSGTDVVTVLGARTWGGKDRTAAEDARALLGAAGVVYGRVVLDGDGVVVAVIPGGDPVGPVRAALRTHLEGPAA